MDASDIEYPKETSSLLSTTTDSSSHSGSGLVEVSLEVEPKEVQKDSFWHPKPNVLTVLVALLLFVVSLDLAANLQHDDPNRQEEELVDLYAALADESVGLLDQMTNANGASIPSGCETTVLLMRHCDDLGGEDTYEDGSSHCSYLGFQRSMYLATLFGNSTTNPPRWPLPSRLYGMWNADKTNKRQYELLRPLSDKAGVPIKMFDFDHAALDLRSDLFPLLSSGELCHQVVVAAFKHKFIRELAATLGCDRERGCPAGDIYAWEQYEFDTVWELEFVYQPEALRAFPHKESVLRHHDQRLVPGWKVLGTTTHEDFDPLEFKSEHYNGKPGNWMHHNDGHDRS